MLNASRTKISYFYKNYKNLYDYLNDRYDDLNINNLSEILYRIKNNIEEPPICPVCGNKMPFIGKYLIVCSDICK
jgi:hypothetical protein